MARMLAGVHVVLALVAFGIGNAGWGRPWDVPAFLHLLFAFVLLAVAVALWKQRPAARWLTALSLGVGALVVLTLALDSIEGVTRVSPGLMMGAAGFVALELIALRQAAAFGGEPRR